MADLNDKQAHVADKETLEPHHGVHYPVDGEAEGINQTNKLNRDLQSRHMQMIAIGTMIHPPWGR